MYRSVVRGGGDRGGKGRRVLKELGMEEMGMVLEWVMGILRVFGKIK